MNDGPPGRPYGLRQEAQRILKQVKRMTTLASVSDRIRANKAADTQWAVDMEARLDALEERKRKAKPVLEAEVDAQESSIRSLETDIDALAEAARSVANDPTPLSQPSQPVSGDVPKPAGSQ